MFLVVPRIHLKPRGVRRRDEVFRYTDPDFEHKIMQCLKELEDEEESVDQGGLIYDSDDDINDPNYTDDLQQDDQNISSDDLDEDNYDSDPEPEENANGEPVYKRKESICTTEPSLPDYFVSKNNFKWSSTESTTKTKIPQHNIIRGVPGMTNEVKKLGPIPDVEAIWSLLFDETIIQDITQWTNIKLENIRAGVQEHQKSNYRATDKIEIKALLGTLMLTAIYKSNHENMLSLFSTKFTGRQIFRAVISVKRFEILITCLRFDDAQTRKERQKSDPPAAISHVFERFVNNCQKLYSLGAYGCIDEMLVPF